jgi:lipopolysaccharide export system permease protein
MKILQKYVLAEIGAPFLVGLSALMLVVLLHRLSRLADLVIAKGVPFSLVGRLLLSLFPMFFEIIFPAALLLAVLLALGRLSADSEATAFCTAGIGMRGMILPILLVSGGTFIASIVIGWHGIPWGTRQKQETLSRILSLRAGAGATEHIFQEVMPGILVFPDRVSADGARMHGVLLSQRLEGKEPVLVFAREGRFSPAEGNRPATLLLSDGTIHTEEAPEGTYRLGAFRGMEFQLALGAAVAGDGDDPQRLTLPELSRKISALGNAGRGPSYRYHFHRRLSLAFSCLSFGLLAIPLGLSRRARGKSSAFALAMGTVVFYYLFMAAADPLVERAPLAMVLVLWLPNAVGLLLAGTILWRSESRMIDLPSFLGGGAGSR